MSLMLDILDAVINTLWQSAAIVALVWLCLRFILRVNAATRGVIWWVTLAVVLLMPFMARQIAHHDLIAGPARTITAEQSLPATQSYVAAGPSLLKVTPSPTALWPRVLLGVWTAILMWHLARILRSYFYLRGVKQRAMPAKVAIPKIARRVDVLMSSETRSPMAVGFLHPAIVLPESMLMELSETEQQHVLLHEAAHLAGYDDWSNLALRLLGGVLALHPVAVWILGQIEREREVACDDWVVAKTEAARPYAESLVHIFELREIQKSHVAAVGIFGGGSRIGRRIETLLDATRTFSARPSRLGVLASVAGLGAMLLGGSLFPRWIALAQDSTPDWQAKAGGTLAFEVASVKPTSVFKPPTFALDEGPSYKFTGGHFSATFPLFTYITFAYKLTIAPDQRRELLARLPKWVATDLFDIEARAAEGNPTKDQMRLMVQSLLKERFGVVVHFETQTVPVFEMILAKPGKLGPELRPRDEGKPCEAIPPSVHPGDKNFLAPCENTFMIRQPNGARRAGSRDSTMAMLAGAIPLFGSISRPVVDHTGLIGKYDWMLEWVPETNNPPSPNGDVQPHSDGPEFLDALKEQLGIKLEPAKAPIQMLIVDHAEKPSAN